MRIRGCSLLRCARIDEQAALEELEHDDEHLGGVDHVHDFGEVDAEIVFHKAILGWGTRGGKLSTGYPRRHEGMVRAGSG